MNDSRNYESAIDPQTTRVDLSDDAMLDHFKTMFCAHRLLGKYIICKDNQWRESKRAWGKDLIARHLNGEILMGLFPAMSIDYLMIDIDNHDGDFKSLEYRVRACIQTFDCEPIVYQSSESGGIRVLFALDREYPRETVYDFAKKQLQGHSRKVAAGQIEIMATSKGDRLPFGKGSYLVDHYDLRPLCDVCLKDQVQEAWDIWSTHKLSISDDQPSPAIEITESSEFLEIVKSLLANGLQRGITTNEALLKLSWYFNNICGLSVDENRKRLKDWMVNNHNGLSNRINRGQQQRVFDQIDRILEKQKPRVERGRTKWRPCPQSLTLLDIQRIRALFDNYEDQLAAHSLLKYVKNHGSHIIDNSANECASGSSINRSNLTSRERGAEENGPGLMGTNYRAGTAQSWKCEIPHKAFRRFDGFVKECPHKTKMRMQKCKLLKQIEPQDRKNHKCRTYAVFFEFDTTTEEVTSLDAGLARLKSGCHILKN